MSGKLVKEMYHKILDFYDELGDKYDVRDQFDGMTIKEVLKGDITRFLMYLSASDGVIASDEVEFIHEYLDDPDITFTPQSLSDFIDQYNIYSRDFETTAPAIMRLTVRIDNDLVESGVREESSLCETLCGLFKTVGQEFIRCDGDIDDQEMADWETYVNMLDKYIRDNHYSHKEGVTGVAASEKQ